jgi:hypothetical protein
MAWKEVGGVREREGMTSYISTWELLEWNTKGRGGCFFDWERKTKRQQQPE